MLFELGRALAGFFAIFGLANVVGDWTHPMWMGNLWWLDLRFLPKPATDTFVVGTCLLLAAYCLVPRMGNVRRALTLVSLIGLILVCAQNTTQFYVLLLSGRIESKMSVPLSLFLAAAFTWLVYGMLRGDIPPLTRKMSWRMPAMLGVCAVAFPLMQMACFGKTSYEREGMDAIVVFGCHVYADGRASDALKDRMGTAVRLYHEGKAPFLLLSGGPGDGEVHEAEAMRRLAIEQGVPERAIAIDREGMNTRQTVANVPTCFKEFGVRRVESMGSKIRVLAVSHFYHLPRVKEAFETRGIEVYTVPAEERYTLIKLPYLAAREVVAFWAYFGRGLLS